MARRLVRRAGPCSSTDDTWAGISSPSDTLCTTRCAAGGPRCSRSRTWRRATPSRRRAERHRPADPRTGRRRSHPVSDRLRSAGSTPVASRAQSSPSSRRAVSSYQRQSASLRTSRQRPLVPWCTRSARRRPRTRRRAARSWSRGPSCRRSCSARGSPAPPLVDGDVEERGDTPDLPRQVRLELAKCRSMQVREVADLLHQLRTLSQNGQNGWPSFSIHSTKYSRIDAGGGPIGRRPPARRVVERLVPGALALAWWLCMLQTTSRPSRPM